MKPGTQKTKGNAFENKIAKELSLWLTDGKREDVLIRSQNSGGRATMLGYSGRNFMSQAGDICSVEAEGLILTNTFILECKHHADLGLESLIFRTRKSGVLEHWLKLSKECETYSKHPIYIARQNGKPILLGINKHGVDLLDLHAHVEVHILYLDLHLIPFNKFLIHATTSKLSEGIVSQSTPIKKPLVFKKRS